MYHCRWKDPLLHFCGWIISIFQTRQHYDAVEFVTDSRGAKAFVDSLDLPFTSVKVALDDLDHVAPAMWMTGKLKAYAIQEEPFFHQDADVFLWKKFPDRVLQSEMFAQHTESISNNANFNDVYGRYSGYLKSNDLVLNPYFDVAEKAYNVGVFGGNNIEMIHKFANASLDVVNNNADKWDHLDRKLGGLSYCNATIEQMSLYNFVQKENINFSTLLPDDFGEPEANEMGYTHLMSAKLSADCETNLLLWKKIKERAEKLHPEHYYRAEKWINDGGFA